MDTAIKVDPTTINNLIIASAALIAIGLIAASIAFAVVGWKAYSGSASGAGSFGLVFLALPSLSTIVFIVLATATLTAMGILPANGCVAIFSSIASFVLGAETQKRRESGSNKQPHDASLPVQNS